MTTPDVTLTIIKQRLRDLLAAYPNDGSTPSLGTDITDGEPLTALPAYDVNAGGASHPPRTVRRSLHERNWEIFILVAKITRPEDEATVRAAKTAAEAWIDPLAEYFSRNSTLALEAVPGKRGLLTVPLGTVTDTGIEQYPYQVNVYAAVRLTFATTYG